MRKLLLFFNIICIISTSVNFGILLYIYIYYCQDPFWYLIISGSYFMHLIYDYSFPIGLFSFIISLTLYFKFKTFFKLRFFILMFPTFVWSLHLIYVGLMIYSIYFGSAERLERAWRNNDSAYVKEYILQLKEDEIEEMSAKTHFVLSESTKFGYGMMALERREDWFGITKKQKDIWKYNIYRVWIEYANSKLFMNKNCRINFQEVMWSDKQFTRQEIIKIRRALNLIADSCNRKHQLLGPK